MTFRISLLNPVHLSSGGRLLVRRLSYKTSSDCIITVPQLATALKEPSWHDRYRVLDAQWDLINADFKAQHIEKRISGSRYFSFIDCKDHNSPYPRMLPSEDEFANYVNELGICNDHHVIIYDNHPVASMWSAPRVWWMFRVFGHNKVSVLDGGLRKWISSGNPIAQGSYSNSEIFPEPEKKFEASLVSSLVKNFEWMKDNINSENRAEVVDARSSLLFLGYDRHGNFEETGGHIPASLSVPYPGIMDEKNNCLLDKDSINKFFTHSGVDMTKNIVASCGSGITACILSIGLHYSSGMEVPVYDGSWSEWKVRASKADLVKGLETGY